MASAEEIVKAIKKNPPIRIRKTKIEGVPISTLKELKIGDIRRLTKELKGGS